jgi:hypothetical protein
MLGLSTFSVDICVDNPAFVRDSAVTAVDQKIDNRALLAGTQKRAAQ